MNTEIPRREEIVHKVRPICIIKNVWLSMELSMWRRVFTSDRCATRLARIASLARGEKNSGRVRALTDSRIIISFQVKKKEVNAGFICWNGRYDLTKRAHTDVITRIIVQLNTVESLYRASACNHRFSCLKSMTNLVHARWLPCHVTIAEMAKMWSLNMIT